MQHALLLPILVKELRLQLVEHVISSQRVLAPHTHLGSKVMDSTILIIVLARKHLTLVHSARQGLLGSSKVLLQINDLCTG